MPKRVALFTASGISLLFLIKEKISCNITPLFLIESSPSFIELCDAASLFLPVCFIGASSINASACKTGALAGVLAEAPAGAPAAAPVPAAAGAPAAAEEPTLDAAAGILHSWRWFFTPNL